MILGLVIAANEGSVRLDSPRRSPHVVLTALAATTSAQSYAFAYTTTFQPGSNSGRLPALITSGHGFVNLNPYVMVTTNAPDSSFPNVTAVFDDTDVWEFGAGDYGTAGTVGSAPGDPLSGFAQSVEASLGQVQGALAMLSLANPTGRLTLDQTMVSSAQPVGTGTVDGVAVTNYEVSIDLSQVLDQPGLSDQQETTIRQALSILDQRGYVGTREVVSIDGAGYIRETVSVASFSDGGSVTSDNTLSEIGCAGTATPGQPSVAPPPPGCVSPDQPTNGSGSAAPTPSSAPD